MSVLRSEDWWSVWLGFALILAVAAGLWTALPAVPVLAGIIVGLTALAAVSTGHDLKQCIPGALVVFLLAWLARAIGAEETLKSWGLGYAIWALGIGLLISNTWGTPRWLEVVALGAIGWWGWAQTESWWRVCAENGRTPDTCGGVRRLGRGPLPVVVRTGCLAARAVRLAVPALTLTLSLPLALALALTLALTLPLTL
jgi:hypothetical protein